jgi:hypothetical protein
MFSPGLTTVTRLFKIANKCANKELGEDSSSEPSQQERSPPRLKSKSHLWHPNGTRVQDAREEGSQERQDYGRHGGSRRQSAAPTHSFARYGSFAWTSSSVLLRMSEDASGCLLEAHPQQVLPGLFLLRESEAVVLLQGANQGASSHPPKVSQTCVPQAMFVFLKGLLQAPLVL